MKRLAHILAAALIALPLIAAAQQSTAGTPTDTSGGGGSSGGAGATGTYQYQRQGIFDCNQNGSYAMSVGAMSAQGGAYVPVADAAVELNTGTLVYKECVLREVIDRMREAATAQLLNQQYNYIQTGRNGNPQYVQNQGNELLLGASDPTFLAFIQNGPLSNLNSSMQQSVTRALAQDYEFETGSGMGDSLKCPYSGDLNAWQNGQTPFSFSNLYLADGTPQCDPMFAYTTARQLAANDIAAAIQYQQNNWNWGRGFYPRVDQNGNVITPASIVYSSFNQVLQSPVQQLQNANDIGQMIGQLYAAVTTQVIGSAGGLAGLGQSNGGPSYLAAIAQQSSSGLSNVVANAVLQNLNGLLQSENQFLNSISSIASSLQQSEGSLRSAESQCWTQIIAQACSSQLSANNTCTASSSVTLKVATSTAFSDAVINSQIAPAAAAATTSMAQSQAGLQYINDLAQAMASGNMSSQNIASALADQLVASSSEAQYAQTGVPVAGGGIVHSQNQVRTAQSQQSAVSDQMQTLLSNTANTWGGLGTDGSSNIPWDGTTNPGNGWCNTSNPATITAWQQKWKQ